MGNAKRLGQRPEPKASQMSCLTTARQGSVVSYVTAAGRKAHAACRPEVEGSHTAEGYSHNNSTFHRSPPRNPYARFLSVPSVHTRASIVKPD